MNPCCGESERATRIRSLYPRGMMIGGFDPIRDYADCTAINSLGHKAISI
jgi:hypothetical protein